MRFFLMRLPWHLPMRMLPTQYRMVKKVNGKGHHKDEQKETAGYSH